MIYSYLRCSCESQNLGRQDNAIHEYCKENNISVDRQFEDKLSGKDFNRDSYLEMKNLVQKDDTIIIKELDRFGRDMDEIKKEWQYYMDLGVRVIVIDMPLISIEPGSKRTLEQRFISNLVFEVLCYAAHKEREKIVQRTKEGIENARRKGKQIGAKEKFDDNLLEQFRIDVFDNNYSYSMLMDKYCISKPTVARYIKLLRGVEY